MKLHLVAALALMIVAGCQQQSPPADTQAPSATAASAPAAAKVTQAKPFAQAVPAGVVLSFPYNARSVKTVQSKKTGAYTQRFTLEYLADDSKIASAALSNDMSRAGFKETKNKKRKHGYDLAFTKEGYGTVKASVRDTNKKKLRHASAEGVVKLAFPLATAQQPEKQQASP